MSFPKLAVGGPETAAGLMRGHWHFVKTGVIPIAENVLNGGDAVIPHRPRSKSGRRVPGCAERVQEPAAARRQARRSACRCAFRTNEHTGPFDAGKSGCYRRVRGARVIQRIFDVLAALDRCRHFADPCLWLDDRAGVIRAEFQNAVAKS